ncbi:hypothetical protein [Streptomyces hirsutus]|uniref:hypothetical protein n=1 Tax=Streptomyces hirsutus TaxID=35620 RepID=UPI001146396C|nr:hypothetical protein [Streptomyces hirsutus]
MRSSVVASVALLLATGCSARPSTGAAKNAVPCQAAAPAVATAPSSKPTHHVELGALRCSDADSGMSAVDITVKNSGTDEANYYVTVEFIDSEQRSLATEYTYIDHVSAATTKSRTAYVGPSADGRGLSVRLVEVKREAVPTKAPTTAPSAALDTAVELFVDQGLVPAGTPYGGCPDTAPQAYWIGDRGNCWTAVPTLPPLPATSSPAQPGLAAPTPTPVFPGTLCRDGRVSGSTGRGTCSHHGGIAR